MTTTKRLRAPLVVLSGVIMSVVALAGPASADVNYAPEAGVTVLGTTATVPGTTASTTTQVAGVSASAQTSGLAFTGTNAIGIGALGGLLLVGGGAMVLVGKRRKVNG